MGCLLGGDCSRACCRTAGCLRCSCCVACCWVCTASMRLGLRRPRLARGRTFQILPQALRGVDAIQSAEAIQAELGGLGGGGEPVSLLSSIDGVHLDDIPVHDTAAVPAGAGLSWRWAPTLCPRPDPTNSVRTQASRIHAAELVRGWRKFVRVPTTMSMRAGSRAGGSWLQEHVSPQPAAHGREHLSTAQRRSRESVSGSAYSAASARSHPLADSRPAPTASRTAPANPVAPQLRSSQPSSPQPSTPHDVSAAQQPHAQGAAPAQPHDGSKLRLRPAARTIADVLRPDAGAHGRPRERVLRMLLRSVCPPALLSA